MRHTCNVACRKLSLVHRPSGIELGTCLLATIACMVVAKIVAIPWGVGDVTVPLCSPLSTAWIYLLIWSYLFNNNSVCHFTQYRYNCYNMEGLSLVVSLYTIILLLCMYLSVVDNSVYIYMSDELVCNFLILAVRYAVRC